MKFGNRQADTPKPPPIKSGSSGEISAYFGEGTEITGDLRFKETVRIDGTVRATIQSEGELVLGPKGLIEGEVTVNTMSVSGLVKGNLHVKSRLEVHPGGRVEGEVRLERPGLVVHDGGIIEARVQMGTIKEGARATQQASPEEARGGDRQDDRKAEKKAAAAAGAV